jgi:hypothetical protein
MNQSHKAAIATGSVFNFTMPESIREALTIAVEKYPDGRFVFIDEHESAHSVSYQHLTFLATYRHWVAVQGKTSSLMRVIPQILFQLCGQFY